MGALRAPPPHPSHDLAPRYPEECQPVGLQGADHPEVAQGGHEGLPRQQGLQDHQAAAQHPQDGRVLVELLRKVSLLLGPLLFL